MAVASNEVFFSFVIPTYNRGHFVADAISSILRQPFPSVEVIVVDDGSTDNTRSVVQNLTDQRIQLISIANSERGAARNNGLSHVTGRYVNYFDSDDIFSADLTDIHQQLIQCNMPPVAFGSVRTETGKVVLPRYAGFGKSLLHNNFLACGSVFLRDDIAQRFQFSEVRALSGTEDWELWLRVSAACEFLDLRTTIFTQREHGGRSLNVNNANLVEARELSFYDHIQSSMSSLRQRYSEGDLAALKADRMTLIALAYMESRDKGKAWSFLKRSVRESMRVIGRKRFWAIGRKLLTA